MKDIGISCAKNSYDRTAGTPLGCSNDQDYDAGLCYPPCEHDADGVGPVCWGQCPEGLVNCGGSLCLTPEETCSDYITGVTLDVLKATIAIASANPAGAVIDISKLALDFTYPNCPT